MDGQTLQSLWTGPSAFLAQQGEQAFNTSQDQAKATLADLLQKTQQGADMHPYTLQSKQADIAGTQANTRNTNANAGLHEDQLALLKELPMKSRVADYMNKFAQNATSAEMEQLKAHMAAASQASAEAAANGGVLPMTAQMRIKHTHPDLLEYFKRPDGHKILNEMVTQFNALDPGRQKSDAAKTITADASTANTAANNASREAIAAAKAQADAERFKLKVSQENDPLKKQTALKMEANIAEAAGNKERAELLRSWASSLDPQVAAKTGLIPKPGSVDLKGQTQGGVATTPEFEGVPGNKAPTPIQLPKEALSKLQEGSHTTFGNGQVWTLQNGQPKRVK
jgi:hypothetical protein